MNLRALRIFASSTILGAIEDDITSASNASLLSVDDSAAREGEDTLIYSSSSSLKSPLVTSLTSLTLAFVSGNVCLVPSDESSSNAAKLRYCPNDVDNSREECVFLETPRLLHNQSPKHHSDYGLCFHDTIAQFSLNSVTERTQLCQRINTNWGEPVQDSSWKWFAGNVLYKTGTCCWEAGVSGLCAKTNCFDVGFRAHCVPPAANSAAASTALLVPYHTDLLLVYTLCLLFSVYSLVLLAAACSMGNEGSALSGSESSTPLSEYNSMYSLGSRVRSSVESTRAPSPMEPPEPDLSHLTEEEVAKIKAVMERAKLLQEEEQSRAR